MGDFGARPSQSSGRQSRHRRWRPRRPRCLQAPGGGWGYNRGCNRGFRETLNKLRAPQSAPVSAFRGMGGQHCETKSAPKPQKPRSSCPLEPERPAPPPLGRSRNKEVSVLLERAPGLADGHLLMRSHGQLLRGGIWRGGRGVSQPLARPQAPSPIQSSSMVLPNFSPRMPGRRQNTHTRLFATGSWRACGISRMHRRLRSGTLSSRDHRFTLSQTQRGLGHNASLFPKPETLNPKP